jgi:hypothetical protein
VNQMVPRGSALTRYQQARGDRAVAAAHHRTAARLAEVHGESIVATEKIHAIDWLAREAMLGHTVLVRFQHVLASDDPILQDELRFYVDLARLGKGEVIAQTVDRFSREGQL